MIKNKQQMLKKEKKIWFILNHLRYYENKGKKKITQVEAFTYHFYEEEKKKQNSHHRVKRLPAHLNLKYLRSALHRNHSRVAGCYLLHL